MSDLSQNNEQDKKYDNEINLMGRITSIIALAMMFSVPIIITLRYGVHVDFGNTIAALGSIVAMFAPMAVIENISYYAIIGAGGVYLSCITGNIMNMKLPSAISGMKLANVEPGTRKGDIISILSIGTSSIVTTVILILGMLVIGRFLAPLLAHPVLAPGFSNIMPSLLGALVMPFVLKSPKLALTPFTVSIILCLILGAAFVQRYQSYFLPLIMVISVAAAYILYKKGMLSQKPANKKE